MNQKELDVIGQQLTAVTEQLNAGLITITEFVNFIAHMKRVTDVPDFAAGLVCPFTGIRYPTVEEAEWLMSKMDE